MRSMTDMLRNKSSETASGSGTDLIVEPCWSTRRIEFAKAIS